MTGHGSRKRGLNDHESEFNRSGRKNKRSKKYNESSGHRRSKLLSNEHNGKISTKGSINSSSQNEVEDEDHLQIHPGQMLDNRLIVRRLLGTGTFGKVWEATDTKHGDIVAVKCIRKISRYIKNAKIEEGILRQAYRDQKAANVDLLVTLYTTIWHDGHFCMVFEPLGKSLLDYVMINDYRGFPFNYVRRISAQLFSALDFIHMHGLIHTDIKLENVLFLPGEDVFVDTEVMHRNEDGRLQNNPRRVSQLPKFANIKIIDFGGATYNNAHKTSIINTRQYRGPEVTLELDWSYPSDIWSAACVIAEIFNGELLFSTHDSLEHLAMMERAIGRFPDNMLRDSPCSRTFFDRDSGLIRTQLLSQSQRSAVAQMPLLADVCSTPTTCTGHTFGAHTLPGARLWAAVSDLSRLLWGVLRLDPVDRWSAREALAAHFFDDLEYSSTYWNMVQAPTQVLAPGAVSTN